MYDRHVVNVSLAVTVTALIATASVGHAEIPPHPDAIEFPELRFEPPNAADHRHQLSGGIPVFLAPSKEFPLIDVSFTFRGGRFLDPPGREGLVAATAAMMRRGGTRAMSAEQMDEELDYLAANVSTRAGAIQSTASINCLASNFDDAFALFMDMVRTPGFQANRLALYKEEALEGMKQRNDHPGSILNREWQMLVFGEDHFESAMTTAASIESITVRDLQSIHARIFNPANLIVAATGDFDTTWMMDRLEEALAGWPLGQRVGAPPAPTAALTPGVYHVAKDIPQGRLSVGLRSIARDDPDYFSMIVMNHILGGGGFTSRIVSRVRSDEGLAYSARSSFSPRVYYPGTFTASFQSKNRTVALAAKIIMEEFERIRNEPVDPEELETTKAALIETFPRRFESKPRMLGVFVDDEMTDRDEAYWESFRDNVRNVSAADVQRVAHRYLTADQMAILVVGNWDEIEAGDLEGRADMGDFFGGSVTHLPLRDPLTLEPIE